MYLYIKALHIIFIITWFAGLFYLPRLMIYYQEAAQQENPSSKLVLQNQLTIMMRRLMYAIMWPSAILTLIMGTTLWVQLEYTPGWLKIKLGFVLLLYLYHFSLQHLLHLIQKNQLNYTSLQLRIWNEVPTVLLFAIAFLAIVKQLKSWLWGLGCLFLLVAVLMAAILLYKKIRDRHK